MTRPQGEGAGSRTDTGRPHRDRELRPPGDATSTWLTSTTTCDIQSVEEAFVNWRPSITRYFLVRVGCHSTAMDLCSDTFVAALDSHEAFNETRGSIQSWLFGIARRQLAMHRRWQRTHTRALTRIVVRERLDSWRSEDVAYDDHARLVHTIDTRGPRQRVRNALSQLSEPLRRTLQLRVVDELSYAEIAAVVGCSEGTARVRVMRALSSLRVLLGERSFERSPTQDERPLTASAHSIDH